MKTSKSIKYEEDKDFVEVSMKLTSGKFESTIKLPLTASQEDIEAALGNWWATLESVIKCGKTKQLREEV